MKHLLLLILCLLVSFSNKAQSFSSLVKDLKETSYETFLGCPLGGKPLCHDDSLKNRYIAPDDYLEIPIEQLLTTKLNDKLMKFDNISTTVYCVLVKYGESEKCNCMNKTNKDSWDIHIELAKDSRHTSKNEIMIVEINGRVREIMKQKGIDWSEETLKEQLVGHMITVSGQVFFDNSHKQNSLADNPKGTDIWRAVCTEIHPIFNIQILR